MRTLQTPPALEPLTQEAWKRIERDVFAALDADPSAVTPPAVVAAPPRPQAHKRWGGVALVATLAAAAGLALFLNRSGDSESESSSLTHIETADAPVELNIAGSQIVVDSNSAALYGNFGGTVQVVLESGSVRCDVSPRTGDELFIVHAADVEVRVVGTAFEVARHSGAVSVSVERGEVEVCRGAVCSRLKAGDSWPKRIVAAAPPVAVETTERPERRKVKKHKSVRKSSVSEARYNRAMRLQRKDPAAAIALLRAIADGPERRWAAPSVYALGQIYAARGDARKARHWFNKYLKRYPSGQNREDVQLDLDAL